jgi:hypothetical protein
MDPGTTYSNFIFDGGTLKDSDVKGCGLSIANCVLSSSATKAKPKNGAAHTSGAGQAPHSTHRNRPGEAVGSEETRVLQPGLDQATPPDDHHRSAPALTWALLRRRALIKQSD